MMIRRLSLKLFKSNDMKYIISIRIGGLRTMKTDDSNTSASIRHQVAPPPRSSPAEEVWQEVKVPEGKNIIINTTHKCY